MFLLPLILLCAASGNLLENGEFDAGLNGWKTSAAAPVIADAATAEARRAGRIVVPAGEKASYPCLYQEIGVTCGDSLQARVEVSARAVRGGYGAYLAVEFHDAAGKRLSFTQSPPAHRDEAWTPLNVRTIAPEDAVKARVCLLLNGQGEALFRGAELIRLESAANRPLDSPVTLTVTRDVVCETFIGFGVEDDGWFYNEENASRGVDAGDIALREARIQWMDPDTVRMFFWYQDWNPSGDWETFTFDSANMISHYRTLDLYQRLGARVNVTGVEWGVEDPYGAPPEKVAKAFCALFEHLIRVKGYTCVQDWTLTNEPNGYFQQKGYSFAAYTALHIHAREEFGRRGLRVNVVGSDDTDGFAWFAQCAGDDAYFHAADVFGSHRYFPYADRELARFFYEDRLSLLAGKTPRKPFVVGEFGFQDARSGTLENPLMKEYPYAVWTVAFCIDGLNRGVAGFSIWCLHEMYYPGNGFMNYGLWDFKNNGWKPRPVYHAWASFCRLTEAGDTVRRCESSHPAHVTAALVGKTLFWVNKGKESAEVRIDGVNVSAVTIMTEKTLHGDRECGETVKLDQGKFTAPPQSFGYLRVGE